MWRKKCTYQVWRGIRVISRWACRRLTTFRVEFRGLRMGSCRREIRVPSSAKQDKGPSACCLVPTWELSWIPREESTTNIVSRFCTKICCRLQRIDLLRSRLLRRTSSVFSRTSPPFSACNCRREYYLLGYLPDFLYFFCSASTAQHSPFNPHKQQSKYAP